MPSELHRSPHPPDGALAEAVTRFDFAADPLAVRGALESVLEELAEAGVTSEDCALCEIVLAEVLNNVVEHAYGRAGGRIEIEARVCAQELGFTVWDWGQPMPGGLLPPEQPPVAVEDLPEGGFGWHLIRALSSKVEHGREGGRNWLCFVLSKEQKALLL